MIESKAVRLSEEIHKLQQLDTRYRNCEVSEEALTSLKETIKAKQFELLELLEKEGTKTC